MSDLGNFDASVVEPNVDFEALPESLYEVMVVASEKKPNKAQTGHYLELKLQVVSGEFEGRNLWDRLNLDNPSEMAVKIARGTLSSICRAVGVLKPKDSVELHNLPFEAKVVQRTDGEKTYNDIKGYYPKGGAGPVVSQASKPLAEPAKRTAAPWGAKK